MQGDFNKCLVYEEYGIGVRNESPLHYEIKRWYAKAGDRFEVKIEGNVIDIVRGEQLIEIQTKNFKAMSKKLEKLLPNHKIILVYPIPMEKWITTTSETGEVLRRRKSPKKGSLIDLFGELVSIPKLINSENFSIEVLITREEELRRADGQGSWRRNGISIVNRNLISVIEKINFKEGKDFMRFLPKELPKEFTNKDLAKNLMVATVKSQKAIYCLKKMGIIKEIGKRGRELLYERFVDCGNQEL